MYRHLFRLEPEVAAYDLHPEYLATKYALGLALDEKVAVQHHHAHIAARMVEHGREDPVVGVSMDGLGYGDDGVLWGGEVLVCDLLGYRRVAHLEELPLPGGAAAIERPWRTAAGWCLELLGEAGLERALRLLRRNAAAADPLRAVRTAAACTRPPRRRLLRWPVRWSAASTRRSPRAAAACSTPWPRSPACVTRSPTRARRPSSWRCAPPAPGRPTRSPSTGMWRPRPRGRVAALPSGPRRTPTTRRAARPRPPSCASPRCSARCWTTSRPAPSAGAVGARLHATVAALVLDLAAASGTPAARGRWPSPAASSRTVWWRSLRARLEGDGFEVLDALLVPVNDGGISLGQAAVAGYTAGRRGELA